MSTNAMATRDMSSPIFVPDALKFYVNRLSFSKNRVRLQALSSTTATPNSQVIVRLPSNTMVNLASLTMTGAVRASIRGAVLGEEKGVALPTNFDFSFIETLSLIANGGIITQPFINYKLLGNTLNDIYGNNAKNFSRSALQGSLPSPLTRYAEVAATVGNEDRMYVPFAINNWISATQTMAPSYISTNLLGDLELRLTMTDTSILQTGNVTNGADIAGLQQDATWDIKHINFYIETASIQSTMLDQAIAVKLAAGEPINVPFENVFSFSQTNGGSTYNQRFSVSSQSVNKIIAVSQLEGDVDSATQKKFINGIPQALRRNSCGATQAQFSVNNQYSPNYQINSDLVLGYNADVSNDVYTAYNQQMSNGLVETRAAMDVPDYDYDAQDKLTSTTQMPFEYLGGGTLRDQNGVVTGIIQSPSPQVALTAGNGAITKNLNQFWFPYTYKTGIKTYLEDKYVLATSFDLDVCDKDRLVSGINTLGSNAQMFLNVVGDGAGGNANVSTIFVLCTSMVQIYQGATLKIIQ